MITSRMNIACTLPHMATRFTGSVLLAGALLFSTASTFAPQAEAQVYLSVGIAPPAIPVYEQPLCPGEGYIWTPGYWAWTDEGYEWINGAWVVAPYSGALWTPGYWGFGGNGYFWNAGYWGREVGYYGGINYGFGYFGTGFYGGYWGGDRFFYNRAYNRIDERREHNVYDRREQGFNGRPGGESFDHHQDHTGFDRQRGSFAGVRDDHRESHDTFANRQSGDNRGGDHSDSFRDGYKAGDRNTGQQSFNGNRNSGQSPNTISVPNNNLANRQSFNNQPVPTRQPYNGNQNIGGNLQPRPVYNGIQSVPGGSFNRQAQLPQQVQQQRPSFTPAPQNNAPRSFSAPPQPSAPAPRSSSGGVPQGGSGFRGGGENRGGGHR